jgi:nucleoside-diphosphate-sugar epimerase
MILVIGGRGRSGQLIVTKLIDAGKSVRVLTRKPEHPIAKYFNEIGVDVVKGDLFDTASLVEIFQDVRKIYYISSFENGLYEEVAAARDFINIAKSKNIEHFVFQSVMFSKTRLPHCASKGMIEEELKNSGIPYSIVSPGVFFETLHPGLSFLIEQRLIHNGKPETKFLLSLQVPLNTQYPWTDLNDLAVVATDILASSPLKNSVSVYSSPLMSLQEVAQFLSSYFDLDIQEHRASALNKNFGFPSQFPNLPPTSYLTEAPDEEYYDCIATWKLDPDLFITSQTVSNRIITTTQENLVLQVRKCLGEKKLQNH